MELKPCPFCGRKPSMSGRAQDPRDGAPWISFVACYCGGYSARAHQFATGQTQEQSLADAVKAWNTRAPESA